MSNQTLGNFGIPDISNVLGKNRKLMERKQQTSIEEYPMDEFVCPVSGEIFEDKNYHRKLCIYKYCKKGWVWSKKLN